VDSEVSRLLPKEVAETLPALYETENAESKIFRVHFYSITGWHWYLTEFDGEDICFGYVIGFEREWGYWSLKELESISLIIRDEDFKPCKSTEIINA
jgi:hypothetical protein